MSPNPSTAQPFAEPWTARDHDAPIPPRVHDITFDEDINCVVLPNGYEVDLDRIRSPEKFLGWIDHLSQKSWMTTDLLGQVVVLVARKKGWKIHPF